jgi:hypothetical protein
LTMKREVAWWVWIVFIAVIVVVGTVQFLTR